MKKVLIVDDSLAVARQLEKIVASSERYSVVGHAKNGAEAIRMVHTESPDIVCMDMNMPLMDGLSALRHLLAGNPSLNVVMISSLAGSSDKFAEAIRLGAKNVISKPFVAEEVIKALAVL